ncbi:MAG: exostosin family protein [Kiritimatiellae bacterium]|nr:exostosin family protein [Kiritimatiellia bacterium]
MSEPTASSNGACTRARNPDPGDSARGEIRAGDWDILESFVTKNAVHSVAQFGQGALTRLFSACCRQVRVFTPETRLCPEAHGQSPNVVCLPYTYGEDLTPPRTDLAFVDGPVDFTHSARWHSVHLARKCADMIILHDALRVEAQEIAAALLAGWTRIDMNSDAGMTLFVRPGAKRSLVLESAYGTGRSPRFRYARRVELGGAVPPTVVTIVNYPDQEKYNLMCMVWMSRVQKCAPGARIVVLTERGLARPVHEYYRRFSNVTVLKGQRANAHIFDHFLFTFKLHNLSRLSFPFLFIDADAFVLSDLSFLWERRHYKPWLGTNDQLIPGYTEIRPFVYLNSGVQLVADPAFYNYEMILNCFLNHGKRFICRGEDQAMLFDYFLTIGYDYTHPEIGPGWNACAGYTRLRRGPGGEWAGETHGLARNHTVHINHYWGLYKPWNIDCPLFLEEKDRLAQAGVRSGSRLNAPAPNRPPGLLPAGGRRQSLDAPLRLHLVNAKPEVLARADGHPFFPLNRRRVELCDAWEEADYVFGYLADDDPHADYKKIVYTEPAFQKAAGKFVFYTCHACPDFAYANDATCFVAQPLFRRDVNRLSNVVCVPWTLGRLEHALIQDQEFLAQCRGQQKRYDFIYVGPADGARRYGLPELALPGFRLLVQPDAGARDRPEAQLGRLKAVLLEIAQARFCLAPRGIGSGSPRVYQALMVGTIPVAIGLADLPFGERVDWSRFSLARDALAGEELAAAARSMDYPRARAAGIAFWEAYCRMDNCFDKLIEYYLPARRD